MTNSSQFQGSPCPADEQQPIVEARHSASRAPAWLGTTLLATPVLLVAFGLAKFSVPKLAGFLGVGRYYSADDGGLFFVSFLLLVVILFPLWLRGLYLRHPPPGSPTFLGEVAIFVSFWFLRLLLTLVGATLAGYVAFFAVALPVALIGGEIGGLVIGVPAGCLAAVLTLWKLGRRLLRRGKNRERVTSSLKGLGIDRLSIEDRLALVQEIWISLADDVARMPLTEAQRQELERRLADSRTRPDAVIPWEEIKALALARARQ